MDNVLSDTFPRTTLLPIEEKPDAIIRGTKKTELYFPANNTYAVECNSTTKNTSLSFHQNYLFFFLRAFSLSYAFAACPSVP